MEAFIRFKIIHSNCMDNKGGVLDNWRHKPE